MMGTNEAGGLIAGRQGNRMAPKKIRLLKNTWVSGVVRAVGEVIELPPNLANELVYNRKAEHHVEPVPSDEPAGEEPTKPKKAKQ